MRVNNVKLTISNSQLLADLRRLQADRDHANMQTASAERMRRSGVIVDAAVERLEGDARMIRGAIGGSLLLLLDNITAAVEAAAETDQQKNAERGGGG